MQTIVEHCRILIENFTQIIVHTANERNYSRKII